MPFRVGSRCWITTKAIPHCAGILVRNCDNASSPPADAPIPTIAKGWLADLGKTGRAGAALGCSRFARFLLGRNVMFCMPDGRILPAPVGTSGNRRSDLVSSVASAKRAWGVHPMPRPDGLDGDIAESKPDGR